MIEGAIRHGTAMYRRSAANARPSTCAPRAAGGAPAGGVAAAQSILPPRTPTPTGRSRAPSTVDGPAPGRSGRGRRRPARNSGRGAATASGAPDLANSAGRPVGTGGLDLVISLGLLLVARRLEPLQQDVLLSLLRRRSQRCVPTLGDAWGSRSPEERGDPTYHERRPHAQARPRWRGFVGCWP